MKNMIWLSPSLAGGAIAARLVAFFERRSQMSPRWGADGGPPTVLRLDSPSRGDDSHADRRGSPWARRGPG
jgi:hypothetical protein